MVQPENIDSGHPNFQLDTRSSGSRRNLDYLSRCNVTVAASPTPSLTVLQPLNNLVINAMDLGGEVLVSELRSTVADDDGQRRPPSVVERGCEEQLVDGVAHASMPHPKMLSSRGEDEDGRWTWRYCVATFPNELRLFFRLYPESRRFRKYRSRSLLLTPPCQTTGDGPTPPNAFEVIGRAYGLGFIARL